MYFLNKKTPFGADTFVKVMILFAIILSVLLCQYTGGRLALKKASGGQGMIPWTPGCEFYPPSSLGVKELAKLS